MKEKSVNLWLNRGCMAKKILIGLPTYSKIFQVRKPLLSNNYKEHLKLKAETFTGISEFTHEEG